MIYFTSDLHINHINILKYEPYSRPFSTLEEMNINIINNWNERVTNNDTVYILGDFIMGKRDLMPLFLKQLNRKKLILIRGNHDITKTEKLLEYGFDEIHNELWVTLDGVNLYMHHQPVPKEKWASADYCLVGHVHSRWKRKGDMINCSQDAWGLTPRTLDELLEAQDEGVYNPEIDTH